MQPSKERSQEEMKKQTLGRMIASLRKENNMTQLELAERMGVTDKAVSKWERDLSCPDIGTMLKLAELFGVSVDELMQGRRETDKPEKKNGLSGLIVLILKGIALAMGIAVAVLSILNHMEVSSAMMMLGIGLASLAVSSMNDRKEE